MVYSSNSSTNSSSSSCCSSASGGSSYSSNRGSEIRNISVIGDFYNNIQTAVFRKEIINATGTCRKLTIV